MVCTIPRDPDGYDKITGKPFWINYQYHHDYKKLNKNNDCKAFKKKFGTRKSKIVLCINCKWFGYWTKCPY